MLPNSIENPIPASPVSDPAAEQAAKEKQDELFRDSLALMSSKDLAAKLLEKTTDFVNYLNASGRMWTWRSVNYQVNSGLYYGGNLGRTGSMGEIVNFPVNLFSKLLDDSVDMVTQQKIHWEAIATNADFDCEAAAEVAKGMLSYYQTMTVDALHRQQVYDNELFGEGHVLGLWDKQAGQMVSADPATKTLKRAGDVRYLRVLPLQVVRDVYVTNFEDNQWFNVVVLENKYELMKRYPDAAEQIKEVSNDRRVGSPAAYLSPNTEKTDVIAVNYFLHKQSQVLPFGRKMVFIGDDIILEDGHLDTDEFPLDSMITRDTRLTNFGYAKFFDILVLQKMFDVITNTIATNITAFATINVLVPDGADFSPGDVTGGMNFIKFKPLPNGAGEPKALVLLATPKEAYQFLDWIEAKMYKLAGVPDDTVRAPNPDTGANGPASNPQAQFARNTRAIQFNAGRMAASVKSIENKGNILLSLLKKFADDERIGMIAGAVNKSYVQSFKKDDLKLIHRARAKVGNPLAQTAEGRLQLAMLYNTLGLTDAHTIAEVIETGQLQSLTAGPQQEMMAVKKEIEMLRAGGKPMPILTQNHLLAIQQIQLNVLNDPEFIVAAATPGSGAPDIHATILQNALATINEHVKLWTTLSMQSPELVAAMKIPNIAPQQQPDKKPGAPGAGAPKTDSPALNEAAHNAAPK